MYCNMCGSFNCYHIIGAQAQQMDHRQLLAHLQAGFPFYAGAGVTTTSGTNFTSTMNTEKTEKTTSNKKLLLLRKQ
jgi:hypothetical protein